MLDTAQRLRALESLQVLDTPPEPEFDAIAQVAADLCDAPIGQLALLAADRVWFKATFGLGLDEIPAEHTACIRTLEKSGVVVVADLSEDEGLKDNILVREDPFLRFYAGVRILTEDGIPIGVLCVTDFAARSDGLSARQMDGLQALSRQATSLLCSRPTSRLVREGWSRRLDDVTAMMVGIADRTFRDDASDEAVTAFRDRAAVLRQAQRLSAPESGAAPSLATVLEHCAGYRTNRDKFELGGPHVSLGPTAVVAVAMLCHELAINAATFGALSGPDGRITVAWDIRRNGAGQVLTLRWREHGGPPAVEPERPGSGLRFIAKGLVGLGDVDLYFGDGGFGADFRAPLALLTEP